jgi:hypothetical protein
MALDRFDDADGPGEAKPERQLHHGGTGGDAPAARAGPAEHRSRAEYYEVLRAADGKPVPASDRHAVATDSRPDRSGWDEIDAKDHPPLDGLRVTPERSKHILDGDATDSGGHRHGTGNPGKTEFPASWDDKKIIDNILDVSRRPDEPPIYQDWNKRWLALGKRDDVEVVVVIAGDGRVWSGWPRFGGPGVVRNPKENDG